MSTGIWIVLGVFAVIIAGQAIFVVKQYERGVVTNFGRYIHTVEPGLRVIFPFVQTLTRVDMRETTWRAARCDPQDGHSTASPAVRVRNSNGSPKKPCAAMHTRL